MRAMIWIAGIGGAICLLLHVLFFDTMVVPQSDPFWTLSLLPTLQPGDRILTQRRSEVKGGELARCASPEPGQEYVIGRVFGNPGDTIMLDNGRVLINGKGIPARHACPPVKVHHPLSDEDVSLSCAAEETPSGTYSYLLAVDRPEGQRSAVIETGKVFLVSDNRAIHKDSRDFGQIDASTCEHIVFRLWGESYVDSQRRFTVLY